MERLWITGFRQHELGVFKEKDPKVTIIKYALKKVIQNALDNGATWLIVGGQSGIETWSIEVALELQPNYPEFQIALMTPFTDFGSNWKEERQTKLTQLKSQVNFTQSVSQEKYKDPTQLKQFQRFMLEHTDQAVIFYDEIAENASVRYDVWAAKRYQEIVDYPIKYVDFERLQDYATEYQENTLY